MDVDSRDSKLWRLEENSKVHSAADEVERDSVVEVGSEEGECSI